MGTKDAPMEIEYDTLALSPLFVGLREDELRALVDPAQSKRYRAGQILFAEGAPGESLFVLRAGAVSVEKAAENGQVTELAVLDGVGDFFGEMVFVDVMPRSATIRAKTEVEVLVFGLELLRAFFEGYQGAYLSITLNIARMLSKRLRQADETIVRLQSGA